MFIAHLPAGYITSYFYLKFLRNKYQLTESDHKYLFIAGLIASVFPDTDLIYFYLIDHRQHSHHSYLFHLPLFWFAIYMLFTKIIDVRKNVKIEVAINLFFINILIHLILDTVVGGILWIAPFDSNYFIMINIESHYDWWVWNFVFHWSFLIEIFIWCFALFLTASDRNGFLRRENNV